MSNALSAFALRTESPARAVRALAEAAPQGRSDVGKIHLVVLALGCCALVFWVIRRAAHPRKLALARSPGRPNHLTPAHILLPFLAWQGFVWAVHSSLTSVFGADSMSLRLLSHAAGQMGWLALTIAMAVLAFRHGLRRGMGLSLRHWPWDAVRGILAYLIVFPICVGLLYLTRWILPGGWLREHEILQAMRQVDVGWRVLAAVSAVVLAPLAEEMFFRGLLQSMFRRYTRRPWAAVLVTASLFAAVHWPNPDSVPALFALGVVLGYNYERTGRLTAPILIHALFNGVTMLQFVTQAD